MTDFFDALARRAVAPATVRPRAGARFESGNGLELSDRHVQVQAVTVAPEFPSPHGPAPFTPSQSRPEPDTAVDSAPQRKRAQPLRMVPEASRERSLEREPELRTEHVAEIPPPIVPSARRSERSAPGRVESDAREPGRSTQAVPPLVSHATVRHTTERTVHERTEHQSVRSLVETRVIERLTAEPRSPRASRAPPAAVTSTPASAAAAPRVEIHIGRIEVMPVAAPAMEPQRVEPICALPAQTLDAYLAARSSRR